ncbi:heme NO-binding domain-containing protein [Neptuniibacter sp. QD37_6]|uniref:heme NO-binding domain-containing protein n=1 Tax=Neptuniibacter sp. QD37_6 TaxID=3398210 RepID=UPI0039F58B88
MKGVVFNILEEMVIDQCGLEQWNNILDKLSLDGVYTSGQTYPDDELFALVAEISEQTGIEFGTLVGAFGEFLFDSLARRYPVFIEQQPDLCSFLESVDSVIHLEVKKLFENPSLPRFEYEKLENGALLMRYSSPRKLCILAEGLIRGAATKYETPISITHDVCCHKGDPHCDIIVEFHK